MHINFKRMPLWFVMTVFILLMLGGSSAAEDSETSRRTLEGLQGFRVVVENIQPNIHPYAQKAGLTVSQIQKDVENRLVKAGIKTTSGDNWLKIPGRPVVYINVNTHETEKYWYAYDIKFELRQIVNLEARPKVKTLADTWSINITGVANIGNLHVINKDISALLERFIVAYKSVNRIK